MKPCIGEFAILIVFCVGIIAMGQMIFGPISQPALEAPK